MTHALAFELINSEVRELTREFAEKFRDMEASPTERQIDPKRVKHLREKALAGQLVTFQWSTAELEGRKLRMNGQHSSRMLTELDGAFPSGLKVHLDEYRVPDKDALAMLFRQFDDRKSARSSADISGAYQGLHPEIRDINRDVAQKALKGIAWCKANVEGLKGIPTGDNVYNLFSDESFYPFLQWYGQLMGMKTGELEPPGVVAAMFATFDANEQAAKDFWEKVARFGVEFEDDHPTTVLDKWLQESEDAEHEKYKPAERYNGCIYAWRAFRENKTLKSIKYDYDKKRGFFKIVS